MLQGTLSMTAGGYWKRPVEVQGAFVLRFHDGIFPILSVEIIYSRLKRYSSLVL
jgi:hypothetical protein